MTHSNRHAFPDYEGLTWSLGDITDEIKNKPRKLNKVPKTITCSFKNKVSYTFETISFVNQSDTAV